MLNDSNFEEILSKSLKSKERQQKLIRLKNIQTSLRREKWLKKYWVPISVSGVAASVALFYLINLSYEPYKNSLVSIETSISELNDSQILLNEKIEKTDTKELPPGNIDSVEKMQSNIISTETDSHQIKEKIIENISYSNANDDNDRHDGQLIAYKNENSFSKENNSNQAESFINNKSHSISREFYSSGTLDIIEDSGYNGKAAFVIMFKTDLVDSYKIDNDTLFVKIRNKDKFNKLSSYCAKNIENFTFWIDKDLNLIMDTRVVFADYLIIRKK